MGTLIKTSFREETNFGGSYEENPYYALKFAFAHSNQRRDLSDS